MAQVKRYDRGTLRRPEKLKNGFLRADAFLTRAGIFEYQNDDGTIRRELRPPEEVFHADSLRSFASMPVTDNHPASGLLDASNAVEFSRGSVGESPQRDDDHVRSSITVIDAKTIAKLESGKTQLSCGYVCTYDPTPGEYQGEKYDGVQREIRGNHVAIVDAGRAGPTVGVRMDSGDAVQVETTSPARIDAAQENSMKYKLRGVAFDVTDAVAEAIDAERADAKAAHDKALADLHVVQAKLDASDKARQDAADGEPARFAARVALHVEAQKHLGETKLDGMSDLAIKVAVVEKLKAIKLDAKLAESDVYVQGRYDSAIEDAAKATTALDQVREVTTVIGRADGAPGNAHQQYVEAVRSAHTTRSK